MGKVESDNEACLLLREQISSTRRHRVKVLISELDQCEIKGLIGQCGFFVGSRMHSCIAAFSQGVPCVGVTYSRKFQWVFESVGTRAYVIDGREHDNKAAVNGCIERYHDRVNIGPVLSKKANEAKEKLTKVFAVISDFSVPRIG